MKVVAVAIALAAIAELLVLRWSLNSYSESVCVTLMVAGAVASVLVGVFAPTRLLTFCAGAALAAPGISYSMLGHGLLEMGGVFHALAGGGLGMVGYAMAHRQFAWRDPQRSQENSK